MDFTDTQHTNCAGGLHEVMSRRVRASLLEDEVPHAYIYIHIHYIYIHYLYMLHVYHIVYILIYWEYVYIYNHIYMYIVPFQHLPLGGWFGAGESPAATPSLCLEIPGPRGDRCCRCWRENHGKMVGIYRDFMVYHGLSSFSLLYCDWTWPFLGVCPISRHGHVFEIVFRNLL
jgi:hypothetical protein